MKQTKFCLLALIVHLCLPALADEISEDVVPESKPVFDSSGKVVSPENQLNNEAETQESKTEEKIADKPEPKPTPPPKGMVPRPLARLGSGEYFSQYAFILDKSTRTLTVWKNGPTGPQFVEAHSADMGRVNGDKEILGDKKTPEGIYFFQTTYQGNSLDFNEYGSQAYTMDYPNLFDRRENKTGSGIWLHAVPDTKTLYRGSRGCIVVRNKVIQSLENYIDYKKTPIIVQKQVQYVTTEQYISEQVKILAWLDRWRESWEAMELDNYMKYYHPDFRSAKMNKNQWQEFKSGLNSKYEYIRVQIAKPSIYFHEDEAVVRFLQGYNSDKNSDFGEKVLHLRKNASGEFQIIAESWSALSSKLLALLTEPKSPTKTQ